MICMLKIALTHVALLVLFVGCMATAQRPGSEVFYFLAGVLCLPMFGSLIELFKVINQLIKEYAINEKG